MITSAELLGLARQMDRAALAIELRQPDLCPVMLLHLLEEDLVLRAAQASVEEMTADRPVVASPLRRQRPHRRPRLWRHLLRGWTA